MRNINGSSIKHAYTLKSMYDNNCIQLITDNTSYRISCETLIELIRRFQYETIKKRIHTYLINPEPMGGCNDPGGEG